MQQTTYDFKYIPGSTRRIRAQWDQFQSQARSLRQPGTAEFVPAMGGCFLVLKDFKPPSWKTFFLLGPRFLSKSSGNLLDDFDEWLHTAQERTT